MKKFLYLAAAVLLLASSCQLINGPDLKAQASVDVKSARAGIETLTITPVAAGTTVPSGKLTVKDGFSVDIEGTAQPEQVLVGWKQTGGSGKATFTALTSTKVNVKVENADVIIEPVYCARPTVLYTLPSGNNVPLNSAVRIVFSQNIDLSQGVIGDYVTLKDQVNTPFAFNNTSTAGSNTIVLKPQTLPAKYSTYVVTANAGIPLLVDFASDFYKGVTFLNKSVTSRAPVTSSFTTGAVTDNIPPYTGSFDLYSSTWDPAYTNSSTVIVTNIQSQDDSGAGGVASLAIYNGTSPAAAVLGDFTKWFYPGIGYYWDLGSSAEGKYQVDMLFMDQSNNFQTFVAYPGAGYTAYKTIYLDKTEPSLSSFALGAGTGTVKVGGYISGTSASFTMAAADPTVAGALGSGESADGTTPLERKQYRLSTDWNGSTGTWGAWLPYTSTGSLNLAPGGDGARYVTVAVQDGVGNTTKPANYLSAAIILDTAPPTVKVSGSTGTIYAKAAPSLKINSTDPVGGGLGGSGVSTYAFKNPTDGRPAGLTSNSSPAAYGGAASINPSVTNFNTSTQGAKSFDVVVADAVGNSTTVPVNMVYDNVNPVPNLATNPFVENVTGAGTSLTNLTVNLNPTDATSGMAYVWWQIIDSVNFGTPPVTTAAATPVALPVSGASTLAVSWTPLAQNETKRLFLWFQDKAGMVTAAQQVATDIIYNNNAPVGTLTIASASAPKNGNLSLTWSGSSSVITLSKFELSSDGTNWKDVSSVKTSGALGTTSLTNAGAYTWDPTNATYGGSTAQGTRYVYMRITGSNLKTTVISASYTFDSVGPNIAYVLLTGSGGQAATNSTSLTVQFWLWDDQTPWVGVAPNTSQYQFSGDGGTTWTAVGVYQTDYPITAVLSLGSGGMAAPVDGQTYTVKIRGTDLAGNQTVVQGSILYDATAPNPGVLTGGGTFYSRVISLTGNPTDSASGVSEMQTYSNGYFSGWVPYSSTVPFLLTPLSGAKNLYVQYRDKAQNVSNWINYSGATLANYYSVLQSRAAIAGSNYANPAASGATENTSYISTTTRLDMTNGNKGPGTYAYITNAGQVGWIDYYLSGTSITFYYQTFNSAGSPISSPWTWSTISLPLSGDYVYMDVDNPVWSAPFKGSSSGATDFFIENIGGVIYLYPMSTFKYATY